MKLKLMPAALAASIAALGLFASSAYAGDIVSVKNDATISASPGSQFAITAASQAAPMPLTEQQQTPIPADQQRAVDQVFDKEVAAVKQAQKQIDSAEGITKVQQAPTAAWVVAPAYMERFVTHDREATPLLKYVSADLGYAKGATVITRQVTIGSTQAVQPATAAHQLT